MRKKDTNLSVRNETKNFINDAPLFAGCEDALLSTASHTQSSPTNTKIESLKKGRSKQRKEILPTVPAVHHDANTGNGPKKNRPAALFLSVSDICAMLDISRATLVRMDKNDVIPGRIKLGGSVRYHRETIEAWLANLVNKK